MIKYLVRWLSVALLVLLAACTGTSEERLPTLLVVASAPAGGGQLQLIEDVFEPGASPARNLVPVPGSERPLPAAPVAMDVLDRTGSRSELVVLDSAAQLHFFNLAGLDAGDPSAFEPSRTPLPLPPILPGVDANCLEEVMVDGESEPGLVALLDSCEPAIHIIDLTSNSLEDTLTPIQLLAAGLYLDQASDLLYYATEVPGGETALWAQSLGDDSSESEVGRVDIDPLQTQVNIAPVSGGVAIVGDGRYAFLPIGEVDEIVSDELSSSLEAARLLSDPFGALQVLVAYSEDEIAIIGLDEEPEEQTLATRSPVVDGTLEPFERFGYLLAEEGIHILDLLPYSDPPAASDRLLFREVDGLEEPRLITWTHAVQGAPTP